MSADYLLWQINYLCNYSLFREERLLILVGLLEHYDPFEVLQHF